MKVHAHRRHGAGDADGEGSRRGFRQCVRARFDIVHAARFRMSGYFLRYSLTLSSC